MFGLDIRENVFGWAAFGCAFPHALRPPRDFLFDGRR